MIESNSLRLGNGKTPSIPRSGQGFLSGVLRCGHCGRKLYVYYKGGSKTASRYVCKGDHEFGGNYCIAFGGSTVDKRFSEELLNVITPFGMRASIKAIDTFKKKHDDQMQALENQLQQLQYEAKRAFEQYNEIDPRNRLVAEELEKRWNDKLEKVEKLKAKIEEKKNETPELKEEDREKILELGKDFRSVWESVYCQLELKKKIIRTVIEEIIARVNKEDNTLLFIVHWKGGVHTKFTMPRPLPAVEYKTARKDLEIIRKMAVHHKDKQIAATLNKLGRRTARGKRWNKSRVKGIRRLNNIAAASRQKKSEKIISLAAAAKYYSVSHHTIKRLVVNGLLKKEQVCPLAPWEIKQSDLESEEIQNIIAHLKKTGKLLLKGGHRVEPESLFCENGPKNRK